MVRTVVVMIGMVQCLLTVAGRGAGTAALIGWAAHGLVEPPAQAWWCSFTCSVMTAAWSSVAAQLARRFNASAEAEPGSAV
jgi:hypothetical protein